MSDQPPDWPNSSRQPPARQLPTGGWGGAIAPSSRPRRPRRPAPKAGRGPRLMQAFIIAVSLAVIALFTAMAAGVSGYIYVAGQLPSPDELAKRARQTFVSSQVYDRNGNLLYELMDPHGGRRQRVPLERISRYAILATIDTEDAYFYRHPGFDPVALVRMVYYAIIEREFVSGGSTITQQVARNLVLSEDERTERTLKRKIREIVLASELSRRYSKDKILELYLNDVNNYGNLAYGIQAAAQTYFQKDAADLSLAEASFLVGLPQSPATYDVFGTGRDAAINRQRSVLALMVKQKDITQAQADTAAAEIAAYAFKLPEVYTNVPAPHFVAYVRALIEEQYGTEVYHTSLQILTTLDQRLQKMAEEVIREQLAAPELQDKHVTNAALVALDAHTGEILAMAGSADFYNADIQGQVNMVTAERQPGSSIKPLTYLAAFEKGWTPSTLVWDVPVKFVDQYGQEYEPKNYDRRFHGPVTVRSSLANSYNVPAVKALEFVTLPIFLEKARQAGITSLTRPDYGLALTLGGGEVPLIEMAGLYQAFANGGRHIAPAAIKLVVRSSDDAIVFEYRPPEGEQVCSAEHAYLITSILSDNNARTPAFGANSPLKLDRPAAAKTGTTDDYRDNWTMGYTPDVVVGVWAGNADNTPMKGTTGLTGAAPIWHAFIERALEDQPPKDFERPASIMEKEICADTGTEPSVYCPADRRQRELYAKDQPPPGPEEDLHWPNCGEPGGQLLFVYPNDTFVQAWTASPAGQAWAQAHGVTWMADGECSPAAPQGPVVISVSQPADGSQVSGLVHVIGTVSGALDYYDVMYEGHSAGWISGPHFSPVENGQLTVWDVGGLTDGEYTLRIIAHARSGETSEARVKVVVKR
ncbi:MAG: transglycosylase domain-containing protein [Thermoflexales bacterium]|nr:transglycosylase domain-containing protein [Thermoflexales bacterium]